MGGTHQDYPFRLEFGDIDGSVAHLREQGVTAADPGLMPAPARLTRVTSHPIGNVQVEVMRAGVYAVLDGSQ